MTKLWVCCFVVVCCVVGLSSCQTLPNNAKYFWCSTLYNPFYPLNPTNQTIPLRNGTQFDPSNYPQPEFKVLPSIAPITSETQVQLIITVNSSICNGCKNVYFSAPAPVSLSATIPTNEQTSLDFAAASIPQNTTKIVLCSLYDSQGGTLLAQYNVTLQRYPVKSQQVKINYQSMGLIVEQKPWFPMGFYLPWNAKFVGIAVDEVRNMMQTPLPYRPQVPFTQEYLSYLNLSAAMGSRVHVDIYSLAEQPDSQSKW